MKNITTPETRCSQVPSWINAQAVPHFEELVKRLDELGRPSRSCIEVIALAANLIAEIKGYDTQIAEDGSSYRVSRAGSEIVRIHPAVSQRRTAMRQLQDLLGRLGLIPTAANGSLRCSSVASFSQGEPVPNGTSTLSEAS